MQTFALYTEAGAPLLGAAPAFLAYVDGGGAARAPPSVVELGGGIYGFAPSHDDEHTGTAYLIDGGPATSPRYYSGAVGLLVAFAFYDQQGAPMSGLTPTFARYAGADGEALEQPAIAELGGGLYGFMPSQADRAARATYLVMAGGEGEPSYYSGAVPLGEPQPVIPDVAEVETQQVNLTILQGATWRHTFSARTKDGQPIDLTGFAVRMKILSQPGWIEVVPTLAATAPSAGEVTAYFSAEETAAFAWRAGSYDMEAEAEGVVLRIAQGRAVVLPEVTR